MITSIECGGHSSLKIFCKRLGINTEYLDYDYSNYDFDYNSINKKLKNNNIRGIVICLSDIAFVPDVSKIILPNNCIFIYDITQIMGLIAGDEIINPFSFFDDSQNVLLLGATHKTLPGPTCGLIMTRNKKLAEKIDLKINPEYLRNIQLHQIASLILTLSEFSEYGKEYSKMIIKNSNNLGNILEKFGFDVIKKNNIFSETHQVFISSRKKTISFDDCVKLDISLNIRNKPIYKGKGIRIGVQEVTRYGYKENEMTQIGAILNDISNANFCDYEEVRLKIEKLAEKRQLHYCYNSKVILDMFDNLKLKIINTANKRNS